jgi:hypothetical protein
MPNHGLKSKRPHYSVVRSSAVSAKVGISFLEFVSSSDVHPTPRETKPKQSSVEDEFDQVQAVRWEKLRMVDIQQVLEEICGVGAQFRGQQKPVLEAIMQGERPRVVGNWNRRGVDHVISNPHQECQFWNHGCHHPIGIIARLYGQMVSAGRDFIHKMAESAYK